MKPICKQIQTNQELDEAHYIRRTVFMEEQNVPEDVEWDEYEDSATHFICRLGDKAVGTARISFFGNSAKLERVAVLKEYRRQGIGRAIMDYLIEYSKQKSAETIYSHVQLHARKFYEKMDFIGEGETFFEGGIEHIKMFLREN